MVLYTKEGYKLVCGDTRVDAFSSGRRRFTMYKLNHQIVLRPLDTSWLSATALVSCIEIANIWLGPDGYDDMASMHVAEFYSCVRKAYSLRPNYSIRYRLQMVAEALYHARCRVFGRSVYVEYVDGR